MVGFNSLVWEVKTCELQGRSVVTDNAMDTIEPGVLGERLANARRARRFTQAEVAEQLGIARTTLTAIEKGQRRPRNLELVQLAGLYGRQVEDLVHKDEPQSSPSFAVQFRRARQLHGDRALLDVDKFERLCRWYAELERNLGSPLPVRNTPDYDVSNTPPERAAEEIAYAERLRLGLGDGPLGDLWDVLESEYGLRVFCFAMAESRISGMFVFIPDLGGCLAINANHPLERQRWTGCHELGHFLTERQRPEIAIDVHKHRGGRSELFADAFARHFLMPTGGLVRRFESIRRSKSDPVTPADVVVLSHMYGVSFQALTWRLEELKLLKAGTWDQLREVGFKPALAKKALGLEAREQRDVLPTRYTTLAVQAFELGKLSEGQLARRLMRSRVEVRDLVAEVKEGLVSDAGNEWMAIALDLGQPLTARQ